MANLGKDMNEKAMNPLIAEISQTREFSSLFDFGNYSIVQISGKDRINFLEKLATSSISDILEDDGVSTLLLNDEGKIQAHVYIVAQKESFLLISDSIYNVWDYLTSMKGKLFSKEAVDLLLDTKSTVYSLQGPQTIAVLRETLGVDILYLNCGCCHYLIHEGIPISLIRVGDVTGEDGALIILPKDKALIIPELLLKHADCKNSSLEALDTLRMETGIWHPKTWNEKTTTPYMAGILHMISENKKKNGGFIGFEAFAKEAKNLRRCGFLIEKNAGETVFSEELKQIGVIKRVCYSPVLEKKIGVGYIEEAYLLKGQFLPTNKEDAKNKESQVQPCHLPLIFISILTNLGVNPTIMDRRAVQIAPGTDKCSPVYREYREDGVYAYLEKLKGRYQSIVDILEYFI